MKNLIPLLLVGIVAASSAARAQPPAPDRQAVLAAISEIHQFVVDAGADIENYRQISTIYEFDHLAQIVHDGSDPDTSPTLVIQTLARSRKYYRGPGKAYRVETSPEIRTVEGIRESKDSITAPPSIFFLSDSGEMLDRNFHYVVTPDTGRLTVDSTVTPSNGFWAFEMMFLKHNEFDATGIYSLAALASWGLEPKDVRDSATVTRSGTADSPIYNFTSLILPDDIVHVELRTYGGKKLLHRYEHGTSRHPSHPVVSIFEYAEQDGHWLPSKITMTATHMEPVFEEKHVFNYAFSNALPILGNSQIESDKPLTPDMTVLFARGEELAAMPNPDPPIHVRQFLTGAEKAVRGKTAGMAARSATHP